MKLKMLKKKKKNVLTNKVGLASYFLFINNETNIFYVFIFYVKTNRTFIDVILVFISKILEK